MEHKNTDIDNHTDNSINKDARTVLPSETFGSHTESVTESLAQPSVDSTDNTQNTTPHDEFFTADKSQKEKQSGSLLIFILTFAFAIVLGLLVFSYIYNLFGLRDFTNHYNHTPKSQKTISLKSKNQTSADDKQNLDSLNASKQVKNSQTDNKQDNDTSKNSNIEKDIINEQSPQETENDALERVDNKDFDTKQDTALLEFNGLHLDNQDNLEQQTINELQQTLKIISRQFLLLNKKFTQGDPYLDVLIDLKALLRNQKIDTPILTEYASGGFPTDMIIVTDALEVIKKLTLIESRKNSGGMFMNIINRFIVITPQSDTQGISGILFKMNKALYDGDFDMMSRLIHQLPPKEQERFKELKILISDKNTVHNEIKKLNDLIIDTVFTQNL